MDPIAIVALLLSVFNIIVTLRFTHRRDVTALRPILVFTYREEGWHAENVGNGPALDIIFHRVADGTVSQNVRLPTLAKGSDISLHFARHDGRQIFAATYRDVNGRPYTSQSQHDVSTTGEGFQVSRPSDSESIDRWWKLPDSTN